MPRPSLFFQLFLLAHTYAAVAASVTLQQGLHGYTGMADAWLDESQKDENNGGDTSLRIQFRSGLSDSTLIRFQLPSLSFQSVGTLIISNQVSFDDGGHLLAEVNGPAPAIDLVDLHHGGALVLSATSRLQLLGTLTGKQPYYLVRNATRVTGTFEDLPEGSQLPSPNDNWFIHYGSHEISLNLVVAPVITAKDYSGFMRGSGYGWPDYVPPSDLGRVSIVHRQVGAVLEWATGGMLQASHSVTGPWLDIAGAVSPYNPPSLLDQEFYRLRGIPSVHSGVGAGCPQQGFDFTGLPPAHWANSPASANVCGWIVPQSATGFADEILQAAFVRLALRSFHVSNNWTWWNGSPTTWEDDAFHQNDGWFHFRVRRPDPQGPPREYRLRFEVAFDNPYAFTNQPLQLNWWWLEGTWDWESHNGRRIFTPIYRIKSDSGLAGPWQHMAETNVFPTPGCLYNERYYRCLFEQLIPSSPWSEIEVAQNLPYTLDDRARFYEHVQKTYLPRHNDLCIRKKHLGYGGLFPQPGVKPFRFGEFNELYALEVFRKQPGSSEAPDLPNNRIVIVMAGLDYEPAGNFVAEGALLEILDRWSTPDYDYRNCASYVIIPIANPDGYEWGTCHVIPYGNGYGGTINLIHRGYSFLEPESAVPDAILDPEALAWRNYFRALTTEGIDGQGGSIVTLLDFQNDLCPHPSRWQQRNGFFPPIYGFIKHSDATQYTNAVRVLANLRRELLHPNTGRYVRDSNSNQGWFKESWSGYGIPLWMLFEFDASVVYSHVAGPPGTWQGAFASPIMLPGAGGGPTFYVHGYLDQIGQATAPDGDPAYVLKGFGRDIIDAVRWELLTP